MCSKLVVFFVAAVNSDSFDFEEEINSLEEESSQQPEEDVNSTVKEYVDWSRYKTSDGYDFWIPNCDEEVRPRVNQIFKTIELAHSFYTNYGRKCGFDVRRNEEKIVDGKVRYKYIRCNQAGGDDTFDVAERGESSGKCRRTATRRCKCQAKITLKHMGDEGYFVLKFVEDHNHPLVPEAGRKFLKCNRQLSLSHKNFIFDVARSNAGPKRAFSLYKELSGSYDNVGATATDFNNFGRDMKARIGPHDADMIIEQFRMKQEKSNNSFFFDHKVDADGRLTGLFWADAIGRRNYKIFGDILSFDPTFRTNRYEYIQASLAI